MNFSLAFPAAPDVLSQSLTSNAPPVQPLVLCPQAHPPPLTPSRKKPPVSLNLMAEPRPWSGQHPECPHCGNECMGQIIAIGDFFETERADGSICPAIGRFDLLNHIAGTPPFRKSILYRVCEFCAHVWVEYPKNHTEKGTAE